MKTKWITAFLLALLVPAGFSQTARTEKSALVVFFSKSGNTERVAQEIAAETGGTLVQILAKEPYPADKAANMERAKAEQKSGTRTPVECAELPADISGYDIVFVGYPLWCAHVPSPVLTFLESHGFSGKMIVPFVTFGGSPFARGVQDLKKSAAGASFGRTIAVRASDVPRCAKKVRAAARKAMEQ